MEFSHSILHKCWFGLRRSLKKDLIRRQLIRKDALLRNSTFFVPPCTSRTFPQTSFRCHSTNTLRKQTPLREVCGFLARHQSTAAATTNTSANVAIGSSTSPSQEVPEPPLTDPSSASEDLLQEASTEREVPAYEIRITCRPCKHRSQHRISQQGYHHGTVMITCPECKNRHVISDHLKIFSDKRVTIEDILRDKGETLKKGTLGTEGDIEFWDDGSNTHKVDPETKPGEERRY